MKPYDVEKFWIGRGFMKFLERQIEQREFDAICTENEFLQNNQMDDADLFVECFTHVPDHGIPNVFCVTPPSKIKHWKRYGDLIDRCEATSVIPKCRILKNSIYPYVQFMDVRTSRSIPNGDFVYKGIRSKVPEIRDYYLKQADFKTVDEAIQFMRYRIPEIVELLCEYFKIFEKPEHCRELKPMLYSYWS